MVSAGARAYNRGLGQSPQRESRGQSPRWESAGRSPPKADKVFVFKTLIFYTSATVLHQMMWAIVWVTNLMLHIFVFNVAQPAFNNTHFV